MYNGWKHSEESLNNLKNAIKGKQKGSKNSQFATIWITDGVINKRIKNTDDIPLGFVKGRVLGKKVWMSNLKLEKNSLVDFNLVKDYLLDNWKMGRTKFRDQLKYVPPNKISTELMLVQNCEVARINVKRRLIDDKIIPYICTECQFDPSKQLWNNKYLKLRLDHINGINNDCRLENLRFICPNCDSQSDTYCGKNKPYKNILAIPLSKKFFCN